MVKELDNRKERGIGGWRSEGDEGMLGELARYGRGGKEAVKIGKEARKIGKGAGEIGLLG